MYALLLALACVRAEAPSTKGVDAAPTRLEAPRAVPFGCPTGPASGAPGQRSLALLVGVSEYQSPEIPDLSAPARDAWAMAQLLQEAGGVPLENLCVLTDSEATRAGVEEAFQRALLDRAAPGDLVWIYFSGHGSQVQDQGGDEPDGWDETLVLTDSRVGDVGDLVDDELHAWLTALSAITPEVTLVLDSCHSGTAHKGAGGAVGQDVRARLLPPAVANSGPVGPAREAPLPRLITVAATREGSLALEPRVGGHGFFTEALLSLLGARNRPRTWAELERRLPAAVAGLSDGRQQPVLLGPLERGVLESGGPALPLGWRVQTVAPEGLGLTGPVLPGLGPGAELVLFDADLIQITENTIPKARLQVVDQRGLGLRAVLIATPSSAVQPGDLALLERPAPGWAALDVALDPTLSPSQRAELSAAWRANPWAVQGLRLVSAGGFALAPAEGGLEVLGPEGLVRSHHAGPDQAAQAIATLIDLSRQRAVLAWMGEGGAALRDDETLAVRLVPVAEEPSCADGVWVPAPPNAPQAVPMGALWQVEVTNTHPTKTLAVSGLAMFNNGLLLGLPMGEGYVELPPGATVSLGPETGVRSVPPAGAPEHVLVTGGPPDQPLRWTQLAGPPTKAVGHPSALELQAMSWLGWGSMGGAPRRVSELYWTRSHVLVEVQGGRARCD